MRHLIIKATLLIFIFSYNLSIAQKENLNYFLPDITYNPDIPTPEEFLGYQVGEWHVGHDQLVYYMKKLSEVSDRIKFEVYARSHENRPLILLTISSPENISNIEIIRKSHLAISDPSAPEPKIADMPAVIYQGFSIHGNEPSGSNASLLVAYYLAAGQGEEIENLLKNVVILFDPSFNPDGLNRFASWANTHKAKNLNPDPNDREYNEAWPRGRTNHYWFDLNRDWLLLTHPESKGRVATIHQWKPNILTDHHEMGTNSSFFFQPGLPSRVNPNTPQTNQDLTYKIAEYHAEILDGIGSLYYSREGYDDYYLGKGSTYPDVNGGVGILFEQASSRGHIQESDNGLLSFPFTIRNQVKAALSTQKAAINLRAALLAHQRDFYKSSTKLAKADPIKAYLFSAGNDMGKAKGFLDILLAHEIIVNKLKSDRTINNKVYKAENSYVVALDQAQHRLAKTVFEKVLSYEDSLFYDVSAWTLPLAFDLDYAELDINNYKVNDLGMQVKETVALKGGVVGDQAEYAYVFENKEYLTPKLLNKVLQSGIRAKVMNENSTFKTSTGPKSFAKGSIIIPTQNQIFDKETLYNHLKEFSKGTNVDVYGLDSGTPTSGVDLGSPTNDQLITPSVMMFVGDAISSSDAGEIWHLLDTRYDMTLTKMVAERINRSDLDRYNVIIMPDGRYNSLGKSGEDAIKDWVSEGGTLICQSSAIDWAKTAELIKVEKVTSEKKEENNDRKPYSRVREDMGRNFIGGAIFNTKLDLSHPLTYGIDNDEMPSIKAGTSFYKLPKNAYASPAVYTDNPLLSGYVTPENVKLLANSAAIIVAGKGSGKIICFVDDTNFRGYWYGTNKLFANAIFFGHIISGATVER